MKKIAPDRLLPMDIFAADEPLSVDLAYAQPEPKSFCGIIYSKNARLWLYEDLAAIVVLAARKVKQEHGLSVVLYDGLRTVTAQEDIRNTAIVQAHPQWLQGDARLLSPPGQGAHPRGMAIDLSLVDKDGNLLDMGTPFDELAENGPGPATNRAHRDYEGHSEEVMRNRKILEDAMLDAAAALGHDLLALPQEWWDFRFLAETYNHYEPLADDDLPPQMRMTDRITAGSPADYPASHFENLKEKLTRLVGKAAKSSPDNGADNGGPKR